MNSSDLNRLPKSKLDFTVPVTGVVGPNGSGKSNVVEAFRFVLGEQSMKSLRGKSGKDLILKVQKIWQNFLELQLKLLFDNKDKVLSCLTEVTDKFRL